VCCSYLISVVAAGSSSSAPDHIPACAFVRSSSAAMLFLPLQAFSSAGLHFSVQHQAHTGAQFHLPLK
jgi:hypothetical protein